MGLSVNGWPGMFPQHRLASGVLARAVRGDETDVKLGESLFIWTHFRRVVVSVLPGCIVGTYIVSHWEYVPCLELPNRA